MTDPTNEGWRSHFNDRFYDGRFTNEITGAISPQRIKEWFAQELATARTEALKEALHAIENRKWSFQGTGEVVAVLQALIDKKV